MELAHLDVPFGFIHLAVNKQITEKMQNIYLIAEHSGFIKYSLNFIKLMI